jgi:uncharacterized membrane protein (DUF2068 family)
MSEPAPIAPKRLDGLRTIALLKFGKALLLLLTAIGTHQLLRPAVASELFQWSTTLSDGYERDLVQRSLVWISGPGLAYAGKVQFVTVAYMLLVLVEGVGLWQRKRWAEWLVVLAGAGLIPFELWKLAHPGGNTLVLLAALLLNVTVVVYLAILLRRQARLATIAIDRSDT